MALPTARKLLHGLLKILNYYRRLHPVSKINMRPFASLASTKVKFKWTEEANNYFNNIKSV